MNHFLLTLINQLLDIRGWEENFYSITINLIGDVNTYSSNGEVFTGEINTLRSVVCPRKKLSINFNSMSDQGWSSTRDGLLRSG